MTRLAFPVEENAAPAGRRSTIAGYRGAAPAIGGYQDSMSEPHPEELHLRRVSKDAATGRASWFETAQERLLTMRGKA
jgi:hypothetical protein